MSEPIKALVSSLLDALNAHDLERVAHFYAPDFVGEDIAQPRPQYGPEERCQVFAAYLRAIPDIHYAGDIIVDGSRAVLVWRMRGTHRGRLMNIPPTERTIDVRGVSILAIRQGKIVRGLSVWDMAGLLRCLGLLPRL